MTRGDTVYWNVPFTCPVMSSFDIFCLTNDHFPLGDDVINEHPLKPRGIMEYNWKDQISDQSARAYSSEHPTVDIQIMEYGVSWHGNQRKHAVQCFLLINGVLWEHLDKFSFVRSKVLFFNSGQHNCIIILFSMQRKFEKGSTHSTKYISNAM